MSIELIMNPVSPKKDKKEVSVSPGRGVSEFQLLEKNCVPEKVAGKEKKHKTKPYDQYIVTIKLPGRAEADIESQSTTLKKSSHARKLPMLRHQRWWLLMHQENETKQSNSIGQRKILLAGGSLLREKKLIKGQPNELDTTSLTRNTNPLRNLQHPRNGENMDVMGSKGREESSKVQEWLLDMQNSS